MSDEKDKKEEADRPMTEDDFYKLAYKALNEPDKFDEAISAMLPVLFNSSEAASYAAQFESEMIAAQMESDKYYATPENASRYIADTMAKTPLNIRIPSEQQVLEKSKEAVEKSSAQAWIGKAAPPSMMTYASISYQPSQYHSGTLTWPGIAPQSLAKIVADNLAPQLIIGQRVDDVLGYSHVSREPWKPGWSIVPEWTDEKYNTKTKKDIKEAESFLHNGGMNVKDSIDRREKELMSFPESLAAIVRNTLTYDGIAIWTERDAKDRVISYKPLSAANIRLVDRETGYLGDKSITYVGVDEAGNVGWTFRDKDLYWYVRNPRLDPGVYQYGYSEIEIGINLIRGFTNALGLNINRFDRNATPNGILKVTGNWNQKQLSILNRLWLNMKRGQTKNWVLPVMRMPEGGDIQLMDLSDVQGWETVYGDFVNMLAGALCAVYRFPPDRFRYRTSGMQGDNASMSVPKDAIIDKTDIGLPVLLMHIENVVNECLIKPRWPHLRFKFNGKNPKEDAREYEAKLNSMTLGERRHAAGLPPMSDTVEDASLKRAAEIMELAPGDAAYTQVFQSILQTVGLAASATSPNAGDAGQKDSMIQSSIKDPAKKEAHGHAAGIRRPTTRDKKIGG